MEVSDLRGSPSRMVPRRSGRVAVVADPTSTLGLVPRRASKVDNIQCLVDSLPDKLSAEQKY